MAEEYLEVCFKLWEGSWQDNAVVRDKDRACTLTLPCPQHRTPGQILRSPGFALCEPSPQRTPVIFQAGGSARGCQFAAASAEAVFVNAVSKPALKSR